MCADGMSEELISDPGESINQAANASDVTTDRVTEKPSWQRRSFLKAAALGTATAAAFAAPLRVLAHTDTKSSCTANDIEVLGGTIINAPCNCTGNFSAVAAFTVINNNNATRKCVTLHLGSGGVLAEQDFLLNDNPDGSGSSDIGGLGTSKIMYAQLGSVPCDFGIQCYADSVVAFQTAKNQSDDPCPSGGITKYPGGQCRRQQICITGYSAGLQCVSGCGSGASSTNCAVSCGGTLYLKASASGASQGATIGTYTFTLKDPDNQTVGGPVTASSPRCFSVSNPKAGTYTLEVKDSANCLRTATQTITISNTVSTSLQTSTGCNGVITFTASGSGGNGTYTYEWKVNGSTTLPTNFSKNNAGDVLTCKPKLLNDGSLDTSCFTVSAQAFDGFNCAGTTQVRNVTQCVSSTISNGACPPPP